MTYNDSFKALSDPTRRAVFEMLRLAPQSVGALADQLPVSRPAVSQHLKVLVEAGLVTAENQGNRRIYSIRHQGVQAIQDYFNRFWDDALSAFANEIGKEDDT